MRLHRKPFAEGAQRYAFHFYTKNLHLVVKESKIEQMPRSAEGVHKIFLENPRKAEGFARDFRSACTGIPGRIPSDHNVTFASAYVIQLAGERGDTCFRYVTAEKYLEGKYMKMSNNAGSVNSGDHHVIKRMELSDGPTHIVVRRVVFL